VIDAEVVAAAEEYAPSLSSRPTCPSKGPVPLRLRYVNSSTTTTAPGGTGRPPRDRLRLPLGVRDRATGQEKGA